MTIKFHSGDRVTGLSTDAKPMFVPANSVFYETNTNDTYDFDGSSWTLRAVGLSASDDVTVDGKTQSLSDWLIMQKTTPALPTNITATADSTTSITVGWNELSTDKVSATKVDYQLQPDGAWTQATATATGTSHQVTGLAVGSSYKFRIYSSNVMGQNPTEVETSTATATWSIPDVPTGFASTNDDTNVTLTWNAVATVNPVAQYEVQQSTSATFASDVNTVGTTSNTTIQHTPTKGVDNYYRIRSTNSAGNSSYASIIGPVHIVDGTITVTGSPAFSQLGGWNYYKWSGNGTVEITGYQVEVLVVGGGGGGGSSNAGGGAGGGVIYTGLITPPSGSQNIVVGTGGAGHSGGGVGGVGTNGNNSSIFGMIAGGGGAGGGNYLAGNAGNNGGGAGGGASDGGGGGGNGGTSGSITGTYSPAYAGGARYGGGAGAGGAGVSGGPNASGSAGGAGVSVSGFSQFGDSGIFANGQRGFYGTSSSTGGNDSTDGTGDGGQGQGSKYYAGGDGGDGVVIIRFQY